MATRRTQKFALGINVTGVFKMVDDDESAVAGVEIDYTKNDPPTFDFGDRRLVSLQGVVGRKAKEARATELDPLAVSDDEDLSIVEKSGYGGDDNPTVQIPAAILSRRKRSERLTVVGNLASILGGKNDENAEGGDDSKKTSVWKPAKLTSPSKIEKIPSAMSLEVEGVQKNIERLEADIDNLPFQVKQLLARSAAKGESVVTRFASEQEGSVHALCIKAPDWVYVAVLNSNENIRIGEGYVVRPLTYLDSELYLSGGNVSMIDPELNFGEAHRFSKFKIEDLTHETLRRISFDKELDIADLSERKDYVIKNIVGISESLTHDLADLGIIAVLDSLKPGEIADETAEFQAINSNDFYEQTDLIDCDSILTSPVTEVASLTMDAVLAMLELELELDLPEDWQNELGRVIELDLEKSPNRLVIFPVDFPNIEGGLLSSFHNHEVLEKILTFEELMSILIDNHNLIGDPSWKQGETIWTRSLKMAYGKPMVIGIKRGVGMSYSIRYESIFANNTQGVLALTV